MKKSLRFASAALAVALAASCAAPAFAAGGSSFTKSETVYAVMNADGSIQSTTVSEHVYSASGLSNVTDQSTLTNIQNTESSAEFTQNGEKLVWNTDDIDRAPPLRRYFLQLVVNVLWPVIFFRLQWRLFAFFWLVLLVV